MKSFKSINCAVLISLFGFVLIFNPQLHADKFLNVGISASSITSQQTWAPGCTIGLQWRRIIKQNFYYSYAVQGAYRTLEIKEKRAHSYPGIVTLRNYSMASFYVDVPLKIHYRLNPRSANSFFLFAGFSFNLCFSADAESEILQTLYDPNDPDCPPEKPPYDYRHIEDPGPIIPLLENSDLALIAGVEGSLFRHPLAVTCMVGRIGSISAIEFKESYHNIALSIGFDLGSKE
ncbi:hypothetical protein EH223_14535 [candidate division KSB1 bacterium]|nr:hypothetical protein [candidate division KSB1 bacterium]RQW01532.1 MAG: hypothetical protein EH223_14535 [candidate division KSB1 bacterium]